MIFRALAVTPVLFILASAGAARAGQLPPFSLDLSLLGGPSALSGTAIASALSLPYGLAATSDGSILWGRNTPTSASGLEGPVTSTLMMLPKNANGSFGAPLQIGGNVTGPITNIRTVNGLTVVDAGAASGRTMSFYDQNFNSLGSVNFAYPPKFWWHSTGMSVIAPQADGSARIYFIVGSEADQAKTLDPVTVGGLFSATLNADSVYQVTVTRSGGSFHATGAPTQVATGLRNPYGLSVNAAGDLIVGDNGQDGSHAVNEQGADTLHRIANAAIGQQVIDYGFPLSYVDFATGNYVNGDPAATPPLAAFLPVADAHGVLQKSEGLAAMAYVGPGAVPFAGAQGGEFLGFHGVKDATGAANYDNALLYYDFASGIYTPILDAGANGVGHLDSLLVSGGTLYITDLSTAGIVDGPAGAQSGAIYAFDFNAPEPATGTLCLMTAALTLLVSRFLSLRRRSGRPV